MASRAAAGTRIGHGRGGVLGLWLLAAPAAALGLLAVAWFWNDSPEATRPAAAPAPTAGDLYARMATAIDQPGMVFHTSMRTEGHQGRHAIAQTHQIWIDVERGMARVQVTTDFATLGENTKTATWIVDGASWYQSPIDGAPRKREALTCRAAGAPVIALLAGCRGFTERAETVAAGVVDFEGRSALRIITSGQLQGAGEVTQFTDALYIDALTALPLALESRGVLWGSERHDTESLSRFVNDFVADDSLPADFFAPESIGYGEADPAAPLFAIAPDFMYHWPGRHIDGAGELPALALATVHLTTEADGATPRYLAELSYRPAEDEFAAAEVTVQEWRLEDWRARAASCARTSVDLPDLAPGAEVFIVSHLATRGTCDRHTAEVTAGATVVVIAATEGNQWNSPEGMRRLVGLLRPRSDGDAARTP